MGVGKLLFSTAARGVDEGAGVGIIGALAELQAVAINNPNKLLNTSLSISIFVILHYQPLLIRQLNIGAHNIHNC